MTRVDAIENELAARQGGGIRQWITSPQLVPTVALETNPSLREREVARMVANKATSRGWRVTLGPLTYIGGSVAPTVGAASVIARVQWGFDSQPMFAEVDWPAGGTHFNCWGDTVVITMVIPLDQRSDPRFAVNPQAGIQGSASIAPAASSGGPRPTRTFFTGDILAAGAAVVPVPAMATAVRWHQLGNANAGNAAAALDISGAQVGTAFPTFTTPSGVYTTSEQTWPSEDGLTLQPTTRTTIWTNRSAATISLQVEYVLDLE